MPNARKLRWLLVGGEIGSEAQERTRRKRKRRKKKKKRERKESLGALPREERKLIAQSAGARGESTLATKNFNQ